MQQATRPPWLGSWMGWPVRRELLDRYQPRIHVQLANLDLRDFERIHDLQDLPLKVDWTLNHNGIAVYAPKEFRHLLRLDTSGPHEGVSDAPPVYRFHDLEPVRAGGWRWESAARGWAAGAALLALLVLLARAAEACLHKRLFSRRRRSEEWPTPNVLATSLFPSQDLEAFASEPGVSADLPPPYYACAQKPPTEDPPPPYSACLVAFTNPKDGVPAVHFYDRHRRNMFNEQRNAQAHDQDIANSVANTTVTNSNVVATANIVTNASAVPNSNVVTNTNSVNSNVNFNSVAVNSVTTSNVASNTTSVNSNVNSNSVAVNSVTTSNVASNTNSVNSNVNSNSVTVNSVTTSNVASNTNSVNSNVNSNSVAINPVANANIVAVNVDADTDTGQPPKYVNVAANEIGGRIPEDDSDDDTRIQIV